MILDGDLGEGSEVVRHEHDGNIDVLELPHRVVDTPHEHGQQGIIAAEQLPLGMLHLEPLGLGLGQSLHNRSPVHVTIFTSEKQLKLNDQLFIIQDGERLALNIIDQ